MELDPFLLFNSALRSNQTKEKYQDKINSDTSKFFLAWLNYHFLFCIFMGNKNSIKALTGAESLLLILPIEVSNNLNIANQDLLKFEVKDRQLVIKKIDNSKNNTNIA
jgi:hypothetical protein